MAEINAQIPLSYVYGPTIGDHFRNAISLADMMEERRYKKLKYEQEFKDRALDLALGKSVSSLYGPKISPTINKIQPTIPEPVPIVSPVVQDLNSEEPYEGETFDSFLNRKTTPVITQPTQPTVIPSQSITPAPAAPVAPAAVPTQAQEPSLDFTPEEQIAIQNAFSIGGYARGSKLYEKIQKQKTSQLELYKTNQEILKLKSEAGTRETDLMTKQMDLDIKKSNRIANGLNAMDDPVTDYPLVVREARRLGFGPDRLPDQYDPLAVDQFINTNKTLEMQASEAKSKTEAEKKIKETVFNQEKDLRDKFYTNSKDFITIRDSYNKILALSEKPSPAGDMGLIFSIMKMYDPSSTVREGEYATAQNAAGVPMRLVAMYNSIVNGKKLSAPQREDFVKTAENVMRSSQGTFNQLKNYYNTLAAQYELDPKKVTGGLDVNIKHRRLSDNEKTAIKWAKEHPMDPDSKRYLELMEGR